jgi:hypothetical protein
LDDQLPGGQSVLSEEGKTAIHEQLERLLINPYFSHSRRFPAFLRFAVERTLSGRGELLKERTLGIEIFGRAADYDTAADPIVRVTAAEIRKRIAQYYQDPGHENEVRILLPSGTYIPQFAWPSNGGDDSALMRREVTDLVAAPLDGVERKINPLRRWRMAALVALVLLVSAAVVWMATKRSPFSAFWSPLLKSSDPVLFCVADQTQYSAIALRDATDPNHQLLLKDSLTAVIIDDLNPIVKIAGILQASGRKYSLKGEGTTDLSDLRNGPTIFVGAFDNSWTLRLTAPLRYHFSNNQDMSEFSIVDSAAPSQRYWRVHRAEQMSTNSYRDYAIVARFNDSTTGKLAIVVAGIGRGGTRVAGEFLTDPDDLLQLARAARLAGNKKNMEIVLSTQIIDGEPGTHKMEATYFW